jgi:hypothetical protein
MMKTIAVGIILVAVVATIIWYLSSSRPSPAIAKPTSEDSRPVHATLAIKDITKQPSSDVSNTIQTRQPVMSPTREQTNPIQDAIRLPVTNMTESNVSQSHETEATAKVNQPVNEVSKDKVLEIARGAIGKTKYASTLPIAIEDADGEYRITFPVDKSVPAGSRYRGPDYAAKVHVDKKTGKVIQVRLGE